MNVSSKARTSLLLALAVASPLLVSGCPLFAFNDADRNEYWNNDEGDWGDNNEPDDRPDGGGEPSVDPSPGDGGEPEPSPTDGGGGEPEPSPTDGGGGEPEPSPTDGGEPEPPPVDAGGEPEPPPVDAGGDPDPPPPVDGGMPPDCSGVSPQDMLDDENNCGACGFVCPTSATCDNGACRLPGDLGAHPHLESAGRHLFVSDGTYTLLRYDTTELSTAPAEIELELTTRARDISVSGTSLAVYDHSLAFDDKVRIYDTTNFTAAPVVVDAGASVYGSYANNHFVMTPDTVWYKDGGRVVAVPIDNPTSDNPQSLGQAGGIIADGTTMFAVGNTGGGILMTSNDANNWNVLQPLSSHPMDSMFSNASQSGATLDGTDVYVLQNQFTSPQHSRLYRFPREQDGIAELIYTFADEVVARSVANDDNWVYVLLEKDTIRRLMAFPKAGGEPFQRDFGCNGCGPMGEIAVVDNLVFFTTGLRNEEARLMVMRTLPWPPPMPPDMAP